MKRLTSSGYSKLLPFTGGCIVELSGGVLLESSLSDDKINLLSEKGYNVSKVYDDLYEISIKEKDVVSEATIEAGTSTIEDTDIETGGEEDIEKSGGIDINDDEQIKALADRLAPILAERFPTREQANEAMNELSDQDFSDKEIRMITMKLRKMLNKANDS